MLDWFCPLFDSPKKMKKRKKKMNNSAEINEKNSPLTTRVKAAVDGLFYMSETDAEIVPFAGKTAGSVSAAEVSNQTGASKDLSVEEKDFAGFFAPLIAVEDWFGEEEKAMVQKFEALKSLLEENLKELKVFKIGEVQIDIYVVGLDRENNLAGIQTKAVET